MRKFLLGALIAPALLASPAVLSAKITRTVEKTFTVQPGGNSTDTPCSTVLPPSATDKS